jgi:hypothetical protein
MNTNKILPYIVDSSKQFRKYKSNDRDITFDFFEDYNNDTSIQYRNYISTDVNGFQFSNYKDINYNCIIPFVKKYFTPTNKINSVSNNLMLKYNINPDNCIGIYYRGTDKYIETNLASFETFHNKLNKIIQSDNKIQILLQTDSAQFLDYMKEHSINTNIIIINENSVSYLNKGIHNEKSNGKNYEDICFFMATLLILSKCKYIICSSGNCSIWLIFFRTNAKNVFQYLNGQWLS